MARRRRSDQADAEFHQDERWLITYADMITLLLAVFIVLYGLSDTNLRKFAVFAESVSAAFSLDVFTGSRTVTITNGSPTTPQDQSLATGEGVIGSDERAIEASLKDFAISQGVGSQLTVERIPEGIAIRIGDALLFASGRSKLDGRSNALVGLLSKTLGPLPNRLRVEGHTDDTPPVGDGASDNWVLSTDRALAVLDAMVAAGIAPARLSAAGYAEFQPIVANTDDQSRARNRRVDILVLYPPAGSGPFDSGPVPTFSPSSGVIQ